MATGNNNVSFQKALQNTMNRTVSNSEINQALISLLVSKGIITTDEINRVLKDRETSGETDKVRNELLS
jgi:polyhydroxyalkanoate synthesis regulator phasin